MRLQNRHVTLTLTSSSPHPTLTLTLTSPSHPQAIRRRDSHVSSSSSSRESQAKETVDKSNKKIIEHTQFCVEMMDQCHTVRKPLAMTSPSLWVSSREDLANNVARFGALEDGARIARTGVRWQMKGDPDNNYTVI